PGVVDGLPGATVRPVAAASAADPDRVEVDPVVDPVEPRPPGPPGPDPPGAEPVPDAGTPITGTVSDDVGLVSAVRAAGSTLVSSTFVGTGVGVVAEATGVGVTVGVELGVGLGV